MNLLKYLPECIEVSVLAFNQLFSDGQHPIALDAYQRGFVWGDDKFAQLIEDIREFEDKKESDPPYYMGAILLHRCKEKGNRFVIDGQQRLTALCILYHKLKGSLPPQCEMEYSPQSARRITSVAKLAQEDATRLPSEAIFDRIQFTVIEVNSVDLAFTFFDTQNSRGVPLHATDLLKAFHLRAITGATSQQTQGLQSQCATRWERTQQSSSVKSGETDFLHTLFSLYLWRAREWTGTSATPSDLDALLETFQKATRKPDFDGIRLYPSRHNCLGAGLRLLPNGGTEIQGGTLQIDGRPDSLPFAIRQPIQQGVGFFLYVDKYAAMLRTLLTDQVVSREVERFREVWSELTGANSPYLQEAFLLASMVFLDKFGEVRLFKFSMWLELHFGRLRLEKAQVRYQTAQNFFKNNSPNLLDFIAGAFDAEQVIEHLEAKSRFASPAMIEQERKGVQLRYFEASKKFFGGDVLNPGSWAKAIQERLGKNVHDDA